MYTDTCSFLNISVDVRRNFPSATLPLFHKLRDHAFQLLAEAQGPGRDGYIQPDRKGQAHGADDGLPVTVPVHDHGLPVEAISFFSSDSRRRISSLSASSERHEGGRRPPPGKGPGGGSLQKQYFTIRSKMQWVRQKRTALIRSRDFTYIPEGLFPQRTGMDRWRTGRYNHIYRHFVGEKSAKTYRSP